MYGYGNVNVNGGKREAVEAVHVHSEAVPVHVHGGAKRQDIVYGNVNVNVNGGAGDRTRSQRSGYPFTYTKGR